MGHTWFYRGCRECFICGKKHAPPDGYTEADVERYRYSSSMKNKGMPWGWDTADPETSMPRDFAAEWKLHDETRSRGEHFGLQD